jgi:hypothetical protein
MMIYLYADLKKGVFWEIMDFFLDFLACETHRLSGALMVILCCPFMSMIDLSIHSKGNWFITWWVTSTGYKYMYFSLCRSSEIISQVIIMHVMWLPSFWHLLYRSCRLLCTWHSTWRGCFRRYPTSDREYTERTIHWTGSRSTNTGSICCCSVYYFYR